MSRSKRAAAANACKPQGVKLLLVAEAPPCDPERYFYFENVERHDWLFRYVWEGLMGAKPERASKSRHLAALRDAGVFLIDLHEDNIAQPKHSDLAPNVPGLVVRCRTLQPQHIVLIKHSVYDAAHDALKTAHLPVVGQRIPFPTSGQQKKFLERFRMALGSIRFEAGEPT